MKQTVEEAAREHQTHFEICDTEGTISGFINGMHKQSYKSFISGAEWQSKQSPWISVEKRLPNKGQRVLVGFLYYYKYDDREAESRKHIDVFTYENGIWTTDSDISYLGKSVEKDDIKVICWTPIPSFEGILESNRDVLERIKEKGD
jgi:hypothetical protein|nr:MAG TPA: Protein of unknown function (DUF551) [Caudoviricetes sp.]